MAKILWKHNVSEAAKLWFNFQAFPRETRFYGGVADGI